MKVADAITYIVKNDSALDGILSGRIYPLYSVNPKFPQVQYQISDVDIIRNRKGEELRRKCNVAFVILVESPTEPKAYATGDTILELLLQTFDHLKGNFASVDIERCKVNPDSNEAVDINPEADIHKYITKQVSLTITYKE